MPRKHESGRIVLDEASKAAVDQMLTLLREEEQYLRISPSALVSKAIQRYVDNLFEKDKAAIIRAHFNSKEYLRRTIQSLDSSVDIVKALETVLKRVRPEKSQALSYKKCKSKKPDLTGSVGEDSKKKEPCAEGLA